MTTFWRPSRSDSMHCSCGWRYLFGLQFESGIFSLPLPRTDSRALAAFCIIGICVINVVIARTVSAGGAPLLFMYIIAGWSSALLDAKTPEIATTPDIARIDAGRSSPRTQFGFRRVMV